MTPDLESAIATVLRQIIHDEVRKTHGNNPALEKKTERALRLYLFKLDTMPLSQANPTAFVRGFLARRPS